MKKRTILRIFIIIASIVILATIGIGVYAALKNDKNSEIGSLFFDTNDSCTTAPELSLPIASNRIESVLYPGQVRGNNFKPHGGFILNGSNEATITLPVSAKIIDGVRYIESGEVQYLFDFETDCGYRLRLDHLHTLSEDMQKIADQLPAPTESSRTTRLDSDTLAAGTVVAHKIGIPNTGNTSFDFGFYDMNSQNEASKQTDWPKGMEYQNDLATHGTCWFDYLSASDEKFIRSLPGGDGQQGKKSVYCE